MTVPSSGTRYIRASFRQAGWSALRIHETSALQECERGQPDLVWGHYSHAPEGYPKVFAELADKHLIVCRDPVKTWATNHVDWRDKDRPDSSKNKMAISHQQQILPCWEWQNEFNKEYSPYIHRVDKDTLDGLGEWAEVNFIDDKAQRYSTPSRMKEAVKAKDVDKIKWLCEGTNYWNWFKEEATPVFADFYEKQGYDLWWI